MIIGKRPLRGVALACSLLGAGIAWAQDPPAAPPGPEATLPPVTVTAPPPVASSSEQIIPGRDFELRPQGRPADVLRLVPGLIINQHQGGGKAEQYLIRGFDADHGTDLAIFVDGVPVNLRSHAHGQGYADLHFLIPETVQAVDVLKGPYFPEYGDFDTAGVVKFITRDFVEDNTLEIGGGSFNSQRYLALLSPTRDALKTLVAIEGYRNDGPFEHPNGYLRFNLFVKATTTIAEDMRLSVWGSHYRAEWHGSGEIPARAVRAGLIDRFGSIDPNEGGVTERTNLTLDYQWKVTDAQRLSFNTYVSYYTLSLFNDFTFFLDDPVNGDMINQRDRRFVAGLDAQYEIKSQPFGVPLISTAGLQYRIDTPHVVLANAIQRHQVRRVQEVDIVEQSVSPFVKLDLVPLDKVRFVTGARGDVFTFDVKERVNATGERLTGAATKSRPNVKANLIVGPWAETELFGNFGTGFHSNDARAVIANPKLEALPTATGYEFGFKSRIVPRTELFATYWFLDLGSELVFVGDDGTTEARGRSHREGLEVGATDPAPGLADVHRRFHVYGEGRVRRHRLRDSAGPALDRAGGPHGPPAVGPVLEPGDALPRRPLGRRVSAPDRPRLHPLQLDHALPLPELRGLPDDREPDERGLAGGPVLLHVAASWRAGAGSGRYPLHAGDAAVVLRRHRAPLLRAAAGGTALEGVTFSI